MELHIRLDGRGDLSRQIFRQIRAAIVDGRLRGGDRLPATRELARRLDVSRNTVSLAYEWLTAEGLLTGKHGAGSFIESAPLSRELRRTRVAEIRHRAIAGDVRGTASPDAIRYDFGVGVPDAHLFPFDTWRRLLARQIRPSKLSSDYGDPAGHPALREAIARYAGVARGVQASGDDIIITNGAQQAFDLIGRVILEPGACAAVEDPGYPPARLVFGSFGARVVPVPVDEEGLDVSRLPDEARLVYVTPSHQFPLGMPMTHARRLALLAWAERRNALIIEDDYDSEFRFGGRPLDTLQALDRSGRVAYAGSFSKSLLPALRLGFLIAPPSLRKILRTASYLAGWFVQWPAQGALAAFIEEGLLARHTRKMRREYATRHDRIQRTLRRDFARWVEPVPCVTGMHLAATLNRGGVRFEGTLHDRASARGVRFDRLSAYSVSDSRAGIVLGYGTIAATRIDEGLRRLRECFSKPGAARA